jgi:midasin (ATPase involved in ribosome maturation)
MLEFINFEKNNIWILIYHTLAELPVQAILKGYWIVFEDIDKAPSDVQSVLLPLLEGSTSFSTGHGEVNLSHVLL